MKYRPVYNLEFPCFCQELNIYGYKFTRVENYQQSVQKLQHLFDSYSEFEIKENTGTHSITSFVEIPDLEDKEIFDWLGNDNSALSDVLFLLSLFTHRNVFALGLQDKKEIIDNNEVIFYDSRSYRWGGVLRCSLPYKKQPLEPVPYCYDIGFEEGINQIYNLIKSEEWQRTYCNGHLLILAKAAFCQISTESAFIQCWTIWEHLFAILNKQWLSEEAISRINSKEKISFILVKYALASEIDKPSNEKISSLVNIRNKLIHFGKFPERELVDNDAILFIRLTEFVISKILELSPSNVFNTIEELDKFIKRK